MNDPALESALCNAARFGDVKSLASLARQESLRAAQWQQLLAAVLIKVGPVRIGFDSMALKAAEITFKPDGAEYVVACANPSEGETRAGDHP